MKYNYIVWVGGVDDYYVNYSDAKRDYDEWVSQDYDEVCIEKIEEEKENIIKRKSYNYG
jgi:hypothetical protein